MNYKLLLDVAVLAGEIMMSSGAETYRVEDTMDHILRKSNIQTVESFALVTGIVATVNDDNLPQPITVMKTINHRNTNLRNVMKVNDISRRFCSDKITLEEAWEELKHVKERQYKRWMYNLSMAGVAIGFAMMLGGTLMDTLAAFVVGFVLGLIVMVGKIGRVNAVFQDALSGIGIAFVTLVLNQYLFSGKLNTDIIIISAMMSIVPGVAITNAIRDTLYGDYLSGSARTMEAFVKAASIALGVGIGMTLFGALPGGVL